MSTTWDFPLSNMCHTRFTQGCLIEREKLRTDSRLFSGHFKICRCSGISTNKQEGQFHHYCATERRFEAACKGLFFVASSTLIHPFHIFRISSQLLTV